MASKVRSIQREIDRKAEKEKKAALPPCITLTLGELVDSTMALSILSNQSDFPGSLNFRIGQVVRAVNQEVNAFDETRKRLCEKYGPLLPDENRYDIPKEKMSQLEQEVNELRAALVMLNVSPIPISTLRDTEGNEVKGLVGGLMATLHWLVVEG